VVQNNSSDKTSQDYFTESKITAENFSNTLKKTRTADRRVFYLALYL
jgi:hypothetical protein